VTSLKPSLRLLDGLAMVVGIMIGSGIFRTPGLIARQLGRAAGSRTLRPARNYSH